VKDAETSSFLNFPAVKGKYIKNLASMLDFGNSCAMQFVC
jgi:hypothetical protein